jgi:hypothetical protein
MHDPIIKIVNDCPFEPGSISMLARAEKSSYVGQMNVAVMTILLAKSSQYFLIFDMKKNILHAVYSVWYFL